VIAVKLLSVAGFTGFGLLAPATVSPDWTAPFPPGNLLTAMGLAIVVVLGSFDGWCQATLCAGEIKRPARNLPLGMIGGTVLIGVVYLLVHLVYFRAMPLPQIGVSTRIGEEAATALLGPTGGRLLAAGVLVSIFGCLSSAFLAASRLGLPMSEDAPACRWMSRIHPRYNTPTAPGLAASIPRPWVSMGAGSLRGRVDGDPPQHRLRAADSIVARCRTGGAGRAILSTAAHARDTAGRGSHSSSQLTPCNTQASPGWNSREASAPP